MKLAVLLLTLAVSWTSAKSGNAESSNEDLMKRAASQLERLSTFRRPREPQKTQSEIPADVNESQTSRSEDQIQEEIDEAQNRIDDLRASASAVLQDPRYAAIMQDRIKRSFISGFANKLIGGAVGAVSGLSRGVSGLSSSNTPSEYGSYGHSYQSQFSIWDFKKAIINTLIQAIKAIGGGAIAGGGALVKGSGYLVSAKGRFISSAGDAITSLGKALASSAIIASSKPVYGPPGYSYGHPPNNYLPAAADHAYDGPLPNEDVYAGSGNAYNADHSSYAAPSNDDSGDNDPGLLIVKDTKPEHANEEEHAPPSAGQDNSNLAALEESFGGPPKGPSTITKLIGVLNSGQPTVANQIHHEEQINYYPEHKDQEPPKSGPALESNYETPHHQSNQVNVDNQNYYDYQQNGQIYDSYGMKLETSSPQLSTHTEVHHGNQDNHQSLALQIQGILNPHLEVPKINNPDTFKDTTNFIDNNHDGNQQHLEPLNIPNIDYHTNHIDHQPIEMIDYYGLPNYSGGAHVINAMSAQSAGIPLPLPVLPNAYPLNNPTGFGHHLHHPPPGATTLGVWKRMNRRASSLAKRMALSNNGLHIQRSVGYRLLNGKLMRI
ncbi:uncharacterized protein [Venturia canescens]|uniref:uncharacterized protein n=1 Tax=Venturia canescens TaxID=32260 RepID=UPI001C9BE87D|nr:uncharacterized protein LOC122411647 [Venturia canescens]